VKLVFRTASKFAGVVAVYMIPLVLVDRWEYEWLYKAIADELKRLRWVEDFDVIFGQSVKHELESVAGS
jgi:hypothetical protein